MPAGIGDVVVELVVGVPAQYDVAEAHAAVERRLNLSMCRYLPRSTPSMSWTPTLTWSSPRSLKICRASAAVLTWRGSIALPSGGGRLSGEISRSQRAISGTPSSPW